MLNRKILLVDDEKSILKSSCKNLEHAGYEVTTAEGGEEAITKLQAGHFDLVITDLAMPGIDGLRVLKEAKKQEDQNIGAIILTGYGDMTSAIEALRLGADDYLIKPCNVDELLLRVERCLEKMDAFKKNKELNSKLTDLNHELSNAYNKIKETNRILPICKVCQDIRDNRGYWITTE